MYVIYSYYLAIFVHGYVFNVSIVAVSSLTVLPPLDLLEEVCIPTTPCQGPLAHSRTTPDSRDCGTCLRGQTSVFNTVILTKRHRLWCIIDIYHISNNINLINPKIIAILLWNQINFIYTLQCKSKIHMLSF